MTDTPIRATALAAVASATNSTATLLAARARTHGDFKDQANYTQQLKFAMEGSEGWAGLNVCQRESLHNIAQKIGRILAGDPDFRDHWDDIAGYARLVAERCSK
jgi:hypothetical protein